MEKTALPPRYRHRIEIELDSHVRLGGAFLCNLVSAAVADELERARPESPLRDVFVSDTCLVIGNEPLPKSST
jgi:hypothetical protein